MKKIFKLLLVISTLAFFMACGKKEEKKEVKIVDKPIMVGQTWVVGAIEPTVGGTPWSLTTHGLSETVYKLNEEGKLVSRYVNSVSKKDKLVWEMDLNKGVKFSDGSEVNADALTWALNTIMEENPLSNATGGKVKFEKIDDYKVKVTTEREIQNLKALLTEWTNIVFKKTDKGYVFSGPFVIKKFEPSVSLDLLPNEYYENADKRGEVIIKAFKDLNSLKLAFESGELDLVFGITPEMAKQLKDEGKIIEKIDAGYQYFGITKAEMPIKQALNLGLNREDYIKALKGGRIANGLFAQYFPFAGDVKVEYNLEKAKEILDKDGWKLNKDGLREKDGKILTLNLLTYSSRPDLKTIMQVMVSQLKDLGIEAKTKIVDNIDVEVKKGNFNIVLYAQHSAPTGDPVYFLNQFLRTDGSKNMVGYSSKEVDALLDKLGETSNEEEVIKISKEIQEIVYKDLPILYLVDPEWNIGVSERLKNYKPYSGDYYIINPKLYK